MSLTKKKTDIGAIRYIGYCESKKRMKVLYRLSNCGSNRTFAYNRLIFEGDWVPDAGWDSGKYFLESYLAPGLIFRGNTWEM